MPIEERLNILLVDDRPENLTAMSHLLDDPGLNLIKAESGNDALIQVLENDIALVLLDVQMPEMDGFEVAELMRANEKTSHIPIIFVTAINKERKHIFKGYEAGAVDYLFKPIEPLVLRSKVKVFCDLRRHELELRRAMQKLDIANNRLQEISDLKSEFLASASHELRTPLTVIKEYASLVHDEVTGPLLPEQMKCLNAIMRNCRRLETLVNDLLDLECIEAGKVKLSRQKADICNLLEPCFRDFLPRCRSSKQTIELDLEEDLPPVLYDTSMMTQVVVNLLGNAHKFTPPEGKITIRARRKPEGVAVEVEDSGPGIDPKNHDMIFNKFTQLGRKDKPGAQGTGLGLSISRKILDLHWGRIKVDSKVGKGARFSFMLPQFSLENQIQAFVSDGMYSLMGDIQDWTLVLIKIGNTADDEKHTVYIASRIERLAAPLMRDGNDRILPLCDNNMVALLIQTDQEGGFVFLDRLQKEVVNEDEGEWDISYAVFPVSVAETGERSFELANADFQTMSIDTLEV